MIQDIFPSANEALALEPEELGVFLIRHLSELESKNQASSLHLGNYFVSQDVSDYCESVSNRQMTHAITEAWIWLEREGMLAPRVEHGRDWVYVTKRGHQLLEEQNWESYRRGNLLRKVNLAPDSLFGSNKVTTDVHVSAGTSSKRGGNQSSTDVLTWRLRARDFPSIQRS